MWTKWTPRPALLCRFVFTPTFPPALTWGLRASPAPGTKLPHPLLFTHLWGVPSPWPAQRAVARRTEDTGLSVQVTTQSSYKAVRIRMKFNQSLSLILSRESSLDTFTFSPHHTAGY